MGLMKMDHPVVTDVRVALCETNSSLRGAFQTALYRRGLRDVEVCRDSASLLSFLDQHVVDLVICSSDLPGIDFVYLVQQIRQQTIGRNPFTVILATVADTTLAEVRQIINAGVDRVARKPISMGDLLSHVNSLISARKPFVATEDYIGPSRRAAQRPGSSDAELMDVPNTLRTKLVERGNADDIEKAIDDSMFGLRQLREQNNCWAIWRSARRIAELRPLIGQRERAREEMARLQAMTAALEARYRDSENQHYGDIAHCLAQLVDLSRGRLSDGQLTVTLALMEQLGDVIRQAGRCDPETVAYVEQIAEAVRSFVANVESERDS